LHLWVAYQDIDEWSSLRIVGGLAFAGFGMLVAALPFIEIRRCKSTLYVLTQWRGLIIEPRAWGDFRYRSFNLDELVYSRIDERRGEYQDLHLDKTSVETHVPDETYSSSTRFVTLLRSAN
jgi:hypothetical protein